jgi:hypothetical protein
MRLTSAELESYGENGYLVREGAFSPEEVKDIHRAFEDVCATLAERSASRPR